MSSFGGSLLFHIRQRRTTVGPMLDRSGTQWDEIVSFARATCPSRVVSWLDNIINRDIAEELSVGHSPQIGCGHFLSTCHAADWK